ncbi:hypothetical protein BDV40DRAFT_262211 [Aspergillus tamarii]|uniref:Uncharacterized protein n=1 Tax=Aspergillus tamarii TaxID=41984 RepID=A0A5N6UYA0_ASPTM|nr:hypothetical protein BDV40DRAFT_262211 [Aspergillus tamarii]
MVRMINGNNSVHESQLFSQLPIYTLRGNFSVSFVFFFFPFFLFSCLVLHSFFILLYFIFSGYVLFYNISDIRPIDTTLT